MPNRPLASIPDHVADAASAVHPSLYECQFAGCDCPATAHDLYWFAWDPSNNDAGGAFICLNCMATYGPIELENWTDTTKRPPTLAQAKNKYALEQHP